MGEQPLGVGDHVSEGAVSDQGQFWAIEFRNGGFLQSLDSKNSGPAVTAQQFESESEASECVAQHEWIAFAGGTPVPIRISRYLDLELAARSILRTLLPGSLAAPPEVIETLRLKLEGLAAQIWTQGWDCREERGPLAGAFGHANRYNPYRGGPAKKNKACRNCGAIPLLTERGVCEECGDCQGCGGDDCPRCAAT